MYCLTALGVAFHKLSCSLHWICEKEAHLGRYDGEIHFIVKYKNEIGQNSDPVFRLRTHSYTSEISPKPYLFHVSQAPNRTTGALSHWNVNLHRTSKIQYFLDYSLCGFMWYIIYILIYATYIIYHIFYICMFMHIHNVYDEYALTYLRCHILKFKNVQWKGTEYISEVKHG